MRSSTRIRQLCPAVVLVVLCISSATSGCGGSAGRAGAPARAPEPPVTHEPDKLRDALEADDRAIDAVRADLPFVARGSAKSREIALTFDDGPGPTTPALLRYLRAHHVPATFFLVGRAITKHTDLVRRELDGGFSVGTHTESHARLDSLTAGEQEREILTAADRITRISRHAVRLFRPPYGSWDRHTLDVVRAERMLMVLWSVDTRDYEASSRRPIVRSALAGAAPGAIVLMHDGPGERPRTLQALRRIVPVLRRRGYHLVSVPELMRDDPPPRRQAKPGEISG